jgi:EAL and modified HD-GYP domain-containing signal transduction protein
VLSEATGLKQPTTYVARQPILDLHGRIHGYELFFCTGADSNSSGKRDWAIRSLLDSAVVFGLEKLTAGHPAFVKCTAESLTEKLVEVLQPAKTVIELPTVQVLDEKLIKTCKELKNSGFRLAVGSMSWLPGAEPLVELADYMKLDFSLLSAGGRDYLRQLNQQPKLIPIAERVETYEDYQRACDEGFTLFQGYYYSRPQPVRGGVIPTNWIARVKILEYLHRASLSMAELADLVKRDPSLTYRLLRVANSPIYGIRQELRSIETALVVVGEALFRRMALLATVNELNVGGSAPLVCTAGIRARFCEVSAELYGLDTTEQYMLGMLSLMPAMLNVGMKEIVPQLPLRPEVRAALMGDPVKERLLLSWVEFWENANWKAAHEFAQAHALNEEWLAGAYKDAILWSDCAGRFLE